MADPKLEEMAKQIEGDDPGAQFTQRMSEIDAQTPNRDPLGGGDLCLCGGRFVDSYQARGVGEGGAQLVRICNRCGKNSQQEAEQAQMVAMEKGAQY